MSFLTRSNASLSDTSSMFSRLDDKSKNLPISQKSTALVESLDDFRQGLRRQLTEKFTTSSHKSIEIPSPSKQQSLKNRLETNLFSKQRNSPSKSDLSYQGRTASTNLTKPSEKKLDFAWELTRKIEDRSSPRKTPNRDAALLAQLERKNYSSNSLLSSSAMRSSYVNRDKSPLKESTSTFTLDSKTPDYKKGLRSSFIDEGALSRTPKAKKESLIKILDNNTPKGQRDLLGRGDNERSQSGLTQQLNQLRGSRVSLQQQSPDRREYNSTPTRASSSNLKTLTNFVNESFSKSREGNTDQYATKKIDSLSRGSDARGFSLEGIVFS